MRSGRSIPSLCTGLSSEQGGRGGQADLPALGPKPPLPVNVDPIEAVLLGVLDGAAHKRPALGGIARHRREDLLRAGAREHLQVGAAARPQGRGACRCSHTKCARERTNAAKHAPRL